MADFKQAIIWMGNGKKVKRKNMRSIYARRGFIIFTDDGEVFPFDFNDYEADDWELVDDDEDWNFYTTIKNLLKDMADGSISEQEFVLRLYDAEKKCRDLILKDLIQAETEEVNYIINKRFGDL